MAGKKSVSWLETGDDAESSARVAGFWADMREDLRTGAFWADRIRTLRDEPSRRLALAIRQLPAPAAFREAAVALRASIRAARREQQDGRELLKYLYWLAAVESLMLDYAPVLQEPGFNVMQSIPGRVVRSLEFTYSQLGYDGLRLLNATDRKWLQAAFGPPKDHSTLNELYRVIWDRYELALVATRQRADDTFVADLRAIVQDSRPWWQFWR